MGGVQEIRIGGGQMRPRKRIHMERVRATEEPGAPEAELFQGLVLKSRPDQRVRSPAPRPDRERGEKRRPNLRIRRGESIADLERLPVGAVGDISAEGGGTAVPESED